MASPNPATTEWVPIWNVKTEGPVGPAGPAGPEGPVGPQGPQGVAGADGADGADGATGPQGIQGPEGPIGPEGPQGPQGIQGVQGPQGIPGTSGGGGDVVGPAGAVDNALALFNLATGKVIKNSTLLYGGNHSLALGSLTAASPAIRANGATLEVVNGNQAAYTPIQALNFSAIGGGSAFPNITVTDILGVPGVGYAPVWSSSGTQPVVGNATIYGIYFQIGKFVWCKVRAVMGSTTTYGTGAYRFAPPVAPSGSYPYCVGDLMLYDSSTALWWRGSVTLESNLFALRTGATSSAPVSPTAPQTWAVNDEFNFNIAYIAA